MVISKKKYVKSAGTRIVGTVDTSAHLPDPKSYKGYLGTAILVRSSNEMYVLVGPNTDEGEVHNKWINVGHCEDESR